MKKIILGLVLAGMVMAGGVWGGEQPHKVREEYREKYPLHAAVLEEEVELIKTLVKKEGLDINEKDQAHLAPMFWAAKYGLLGSVDQLLKLGADPVIQDGYSTVLHMAVSKGFDDVVVLLLKKHRMDPDQELNNRTPLAIAMRWGHMETFKLLLEWGADPNALNEGRTGSVLVDAIEKKNDVAIALLLKHGADPEFKLPGRNRVSPFVMAVRTNQMEVVQELLERGMKINPKNDWYSPLLISLTSETQCFGKRGEGKLECEVVREIATLLMEKGADVCADGILEAAIRINHDEIIRKALKKSCLNSEEFPGALFQALMNNNESLAKTLMHKGADINGVIEVGKCPYGRSFISEHQTLLMSIIENRDLQSVELALKLGADPNLATDDGLTPLVIAAAMGQVEIVQRLIKAGGRVNDIHKQTIQISFNQIVRQAHTTLEFAFHSDYLSMNCFTYEFSMNSQEISHAIIPFEYRLSHYNEVNNLDFSPFPRLELIKTLLEGGANDELEPFLFLIVKDAEWGDYRSHPACYADLLELLLEYGADSNKAQLTHMLKGKVERIIPRGIPILHYLAQMNCECSKGIFDLLVKAGADTTIKNSEGLTAIEVLAKRPPPPPAPEPSEFELEYLKNITKNSFEEAVKERGK